MSSKRSVPPAYQLLASRLREVRISERFSQEELAKEALLQRTALSNYEYGIAKLPFSAGLAICRRLDLNPRWLATGDEPKRPFIALHEMGIEEYPTSPRYGFIEGYEEVIRPRIDELLKSEGIEGAVARVLKSPVGRRDSKETLEQEILWTAAQIATASDRVKQLGNLSLLETYIGELKQRLKISR